MAVLVSGEVFAGVSEGGTAPVETVGVVYSLAAGLIYCCQWESLTSGGLNKRVPSPHPS